MKNYIELFKTFEEIENRGLAYERVEYITEDNLYDDDIEVMCAKHTLWRLSVAPDDYEFNTDGINFYRKYIEHKNLCSAGINNCTVSGCHFRNIDMVGFHANNVSFIDCEFKDILAESFKFTNCYFENCSIEADHDLDFSLSDFSYSTFKDCRFDCLTFDILCEKGLGIIDTDSAGNTIHMIPLDDGFYR